METRRPDQNERCRPNGNSVDLANQELGTTALSIPVCVFVSCLCTIKLYASIIPNLFKFDDAFFEAFGLILVRCTLYLLCDGC